MTNISIRSWVSGQRVTITKIYTRLRPWIGGLLCCLKQAGSWFLNTIDILALVTTSYGAVLCFVGCLAEPIRSRSTPSNCDNHNRLQTCSRFTSPGCWGGITAPMEDHWPNPSHPTRCGTAILMASSLLKYQMNRLQTLQNCFKTRHRGTYLGNPLTPKRVTDKSTVPYVLQNDMSVQRRNMTPANLITVI